MDTDKKQILESCLKVIKGLSDKEYQKRVWIRGEGPEVDDFDETVCNFFQDGNGIIENYKDFGLTKGQHVLLTKFRDVFESFSDENNWPQEFIDTPEWTQITEMAKEVLKAFNYQRSTG